MSLKANESKCPECARWVPLNTLGVRMSHPCRGRMSEPERCGPPVLTCTGAHVADEKAGPVPDCWDFTCPCGRQFDAASDDALAAELPPRDLTGPRRQVDFVLPYFEVIEDIHCSRCDAFHTTRDLTAALHGYIRKLWEEAE